MVRKKPKSKRQTLHHKYKVERKIKEHHRKVRREERKNPSLRKKLKKDPGIPNSWPLKEEFLQKMENQKAKLEAEQAKQREARMREQMKKRSLPSLVQDASARSKQFEMKEKEKQSQEDQKRSAALYNIKDGSKRAYFREFRKIVESADVILEVLDARDPLGCRCTEVERRILEKDPNKKIILVVNKIDLVPRDNVEAWLKYLRNEFPAIAFKCSTQEQRKHLSHSSMSTNVAPSSILETSDCLGSDTLLQLLKNYSRNLNLKTAVTVGIIGYPNVGKSSLINSLKRSKAVGVGATPGFTKTVQEIHLDKNVKLLDCPGIVFGSSSENDIVLRNAVKIEQIPDPIEPVELILKRCKREQLLETYRIPTFENITEFLTLIAGKRGKLSKGGIADLPAAARSILQDWNGGKIPFYTIPPAVKGVHVGAAVVSQWGKQFDLDKVFENEKATVFAHLPANSNGSLMALTPGKETAEGEFFDDEEDEMEDDDDESEGEEDDDDEEGDEMVDEELPMQSRTVTFDLPKKKAAVTTTTKQNLRTKEDLVNPQINQQMKKQLKKKRKEKKKISFADEEDDDEMDGDGDYDFSTDFMPQNEELKGQINMSDDEIELDDI